MLSINCYVDIGGQFNRKTAKLTVLMYACLLNHGWWHGFLFRNIKSSRIGLSTHTLLSHRTTWVQLQHVATQPLYPPRPISLRGQCCSPILHIANQANISNTPMKVPAVTLVRRQPDWGLAGWKCKAANIQGSKHTYSDSLQQALSKKV
jgi:hypothetical protein